VEKTAVEKFENGVFTLKIASNVFRPRYAEGIQKHNNHRSFWFYVGENIGQGYHAVFKIFSVHIKTKSWRFQ